MKPRTLAMIPVALLLALCAPAFAGGNGADAVHHQLQVRLDPAGHTLGVIETVTLPERYVLSASDGIQFLLHSGLAPESATEGVVLEAVPGPPDPAAFGLDEKNQEVPESDQVSVYRLTAEAGGALPAVIRLSYGGVIHHPLEESGEEYAQSFSQTPGTIQEDGVFLSGSTYWYPWFGYDMVTFGLEVTKPAGWNVLSEGTRIADESDRVRWESDSPVDEIHICAGPFTVYEDQAGSVATYAYLRTPDEALARKYLDTTASYLEMYRVLLGRYPYEKFALVENFWETGYGMPSFTLLGPKIIRFPFILHSSYPHEILHNWWGNGVFVEYETGNWCEGLTAYLADHLIKEQRGQGAAYRRDQLQKYADYVSGDEDFPLTAFRSRHSGATQAVGYGKTAMMFHMLRMELGDDTFTAGLRKLYKDNAFRRASFEDVQTAFEGPAGRDMSSFFDAWVRRTGAPALAIESAEASSIGGSGLHLVLRQIQDGEPFPLLVPVAITIEGSDQAVLVNLAMSGKVLDQTIPLSGTPVRVQVDPEFDLFRRLDRREIPPSLGQAFGAEQVTLVLPSGASPAVLKGYRELAESWSGSQGGSVDTVLDTDLDGIPVDRAVWVLGWDNRFLPAVSDGVGMYGADLAVDGLVHGDDRLSRSDRSVVVDMGNPANPDMAVAFLGADNVAAMPGLGRKLPHYGKYGYLGFEGDEPSNMYKGSWSAVGSPMDAVTGDPGGERPEAGARPARQALATLPPVFSEKAMREHVELLAADDLEGRGCGSPGLLQAAAYIESRFGTLGLMPGAGSGSYRMPWTTKCGPDAVATGQVNLLGALPGGNPKYNGESVVVVAHYDHLGRGWPMGHVDDQGQIYNGADDNASGVAVMLELARVVAAGPRPERTILFLAVSGEESGLQGSMEYVRNPAKWPVNKIIGVLNIDTVGRLEGRPVLVLGAGSADEWRHIVFGADYVTGVKAKSVTDDLGASDQKPFLEAGVPAVQFFSGPHLDYHRAGDDPEKLDYAGMVKAAAFIKEFVEYLAARETPMTSQLQGAAGKDRLAKPAPPTGRRVSLGTVPDFTWEGEGLRVTGTVPGSPAAAAGLQEGDILVELAGESVDGLKGLSGILKTLKPGDTVALAWLRDGERHEAEVELKAR